jgi:hypothetical protein
MYQKVQKLLLIVITSALLIVAVIRNSISVLTDNIVLFKEPTYSLIVTSYNFRKENQCMIEYQIKVNQILVKPAITDGLKPCLWRCISWTRAVRIHCLISCATQILEQ